MDVERVLRRDFPAERFAALLNTLDEYGAMDWEPERERVQLAILKLAAGDPDKVRDALETAKCDFRFVLSPAEFPGYEKCTFRLSTIRPDERQQIIDADWQRYQKWLTR